MGTSPNNAITLKTTEGHLKLRNLVTVRVPVHTKTTEKRGIGTLRPPEVREEHGSLKLESADPDGDPRANTHCKAKGEPGANGAII